MAEGVLRFKGKTVEEMNREELVEALKYASEIISRGELHRLPPRQLGREETIITEYATIRIQSGVGSPAGATGFLMTVSPHKP